MRDEWGRALAACAAPTAAPREARRHAVPLRARVPVVILAVALVAGGIGVLAAHHPAQRSALPRARATVHPTAEIIAARLPLSTSATLALEQAAAATIALHPVSHDGLPGISRRFFDAIPRGTTGQNPDPLADTDQYRDAETTVGVHQPPAPAPLFRSAGLTGGRVVIGVVLTTGTAWRCTVQVVPTTGHSDEGTAPGTTTVAVRGDASQGALQFATVAIPDGTAVTRIAFATADPRTQYVWQVLHQVP